MDVWKADRAKAGFPKSHQADNTIRVYTTPLDTLYGATYMVLAPEHAAVETLTTTDQAAMVKRYCNDAAINSDLLGHGVWEHVGNEIKGVTNNAWFGRTVSLNDDGSILAVGAPGDSLSSKERPPYSSTSLFSTYPVSYSVLGR